MKAQFALYALITCISCAHYSCSSSSGTPAIYEPKEEVKAVLFDGNFKGRINQTDVTVSVKNNNGQISGTYTQPDANFTLTGSIDANNVLNARMGNGLFTLNCKGYYQGYNLVLELDENAINLMRLYFLFNDEAALAGQLENKLVLQKQ
ncbi:MAG: hypothetical protein KF862_26800 [Chitinophagaceae bacterium]|nr:hypothetical protein [Chitinophagaceae bacterium]